MGGLGVLEHLDCLLYIFSYEYEVLGLLSHVALDFEVVHLLHENLRPDSEQVHYHENQSFLLVHDVDLRRLRQLQLLVNCRDVLVSR